MKYINCTDAELEAFVKARKLTLRVFSGDEPKRLQRLEYISALRNADVSKTFHGFLDLPAELRNSVYEFSLRRGQPKTPCSIPLLVTSKQLRVEAAHIFYSNKKFTISISGEEVFCQSHRCGTYRLFEQTGHGPEPVSHPDYMSLRWPLYLRKVKWLQLTILDAPWNCDFDQRKAFVENITFSLCMYLRIKHNVTTLCIENRCVELSYSELPKLDLYPLRLLGNLRKFETKGLTQDPELHANTLSFFSEAQHTRFKNRQDPDVLEDAYCKAHRASTKALDQLSKACKKTNSVESSGRITSQLTKFSFELVGRVMAEHQRKTLEKVDWANQASFNCIIRLARDRRPLPFELANEEIPKAVTSFLRAYVDCEIVLREFENLRDQQGFFSTPDHLQREMDPWNLAACTFAAVVLLVAIGIWIYTMLVVVVVLGQKVIGMLRA